jgi:hypothetical protein
MLTLCLKIGSVRACAKNHQFWRSTAKTWPKQIKLNKNNDHISVVSLLNDINHDDNQPQ